MFTIMIVIIALLVTALAFTIKETVFKWPMLHGAGVIIWLVATVQLVVYAVATYPGTVAVLGSALFGSTMVIIHTVSILLPYLRGRTNEMQKYEMRQADYKHKIAKMSSKNKEKMWWQ